MSYKILFIVSIVFLFQIISVNAQESIKWNIDRTDSIGGYPAEGLPELPVIVETPEGKAALFNGKNQALLVKGNPLGNTEEFTIEVIFKPDSSLRPGKSGAKIYTFRKITDAKSRILMEIRLLKNQKWALDSYVGSENSSSILLDSVTADKLHSAGQWYNVTLVYKNQTVTHYINGVKELHGSVNFHSLPDANISIGARQNPKSWFNGYIKTIRFTKHALQPNEFLKP